MRRFLTLMLTAAALAAGLAPATSAQAPAASAQAPADSANPPVPAAGRPLLQPSAIDLGNTEVLSGPVDPGAYRLGPGDVLSLEMSGRMDRQWPLRVDAEGRTNVPEIGVVDVGGKTLATARQEILGRVKPFYSGVRLDLRLVQLRAFKVYVAGELAASGAIRATGATRASELFTGLYALKPTASRRNIELRHRSGERRLVDLEAFSYLGRAEANPYLEDGDVLVVPPRKELVYAYGAFGRPGEFELAPGDRVADLIDLAGGLLPSTDLASGLLIRFMSPTTLDSIAVDLGAAGGARDLRPLKNHDRLFAREIPDFERADNVTLAGEVVRPGPYAIQPGVDRVSNVLARAGGLTAVAASHRLQIYRGTEIAGQRDIEFERLSRLSRSEMTDAEYQAFKTKLASQQAMFVFDYGTLDSVGADHDVLLKNGDIIAVDRELQSVRVAGEVQRPALLEYHPKLTGYDYIRLAGGMTSRAWRGKVRVTRAGSNQSLALEEARSIQPGDFIWVPEKKDVSFWAVFKDVILVAGSVATVIILIQNNR